MTETLLRFFTTLMIGPYLEAVESAIGALEGLSRCYQSRG